MIGKNVTRRRFLKGLAVTGLGAAGAQLLAACAAPAPAAAPATDSTDAASAPAATDVAVRVQAPAGDGASMSIEFAQRYQDDTGVEVIIEETIYNEIETKTQTGYISGTLQDVVYGHHRWLFINFVKGIYMELDDLWASDPLPDFDDIYPSVLTGNTLDGKNFSVPVHVHPGGNIAVNYNKTWLDERGVAEPQPGWTFDDWTEMARNAADTETNIFGIGFEGMNSFHYYSNVSRAFGAPDSRDGWLMNEEGTQITYNTELHEQIGMWYLDLLENKVAMRQADYIENNPANVFQAGLAATFASNAGVVANNVRIIEDRFELGVVLLPVGPEGRYGSCYSGNQYMLNSATENPEEAYGLLQYYSSADAGIFQVVTGVRMPNGHKSAWTNEDVNNVSSIYGICDSVLTEGIEPFPMPRNTRFTEANNIFQNEIDLVWEGQADWASQAAVIEERVQEVLDQDRPE
ncbi:MAG: extracellular solute-binding protein [Litorilinea sp.]